MNGTGNGRTVCNFCGEDIAADAKRCPYCGSVLGMSSGFKIDEGKTEDFDDNSSPANVIKMDISKSSFELDNVKSDNSVKAFMDEEKVFDSKIEEGLTRIKPDEQIFDETQENLDNPAISETQAPQTANTVQQVSMGNNVGQPSNQGSVIHRQSAEGKPSLSNAMKVFLTAICNLIPGIGQLVGVIVAIVL